MDEDTLRTPNSSNSENVLHPVIDLLRRALTGMLKTDFTIDEEHVLTLSQFRRVFMALDLFPQPLSLQIVQ